MCPYRKNDKRNLGLKDKSSMERLGVASLTTHYDISSFAVSAIEVFDTDRMVEILQGF